jgi:hypothetical protein
MLRSSYDACGCSTQTTSIINLKRSTLHPHEGQADRPNTPSDSINLGSNSEVLHATALLIELFRVSPGKVWAVIQLVPKKPYSKDCHDEN